MSGDGIECKVAFYANVPRRTHRIVCLDRLIGHVWSNGHFEIFDDEPAHQDSARPMSGETQT